MGKVGLHQGPRLLSGLDTRLESRWTMTFADDTVMCGESRGESREVEECPGKEKKETIAIARQNVRK